MTYLQGNKRYENLVAQHYRLRDCSRKPPYSNHSRQTHVKRPAPSECRTIQYNAVLARMDIIRFIYDQGGLIKNECLLEIDRYAERSALRAGLLGFESFFLIAITLNIAQLFFRVIG